MEYAVLPTDGVHGSSTWIECLDVRVVRRNPGGGTIRQALDGVDTGTTLSDGGGGEGAANGNVSDLTL